MSLSDVCLEAAATLRRGIGKYRKEQEKQFFSDFPKQYSEKYFVRMKELQKGLEHLGLEIGLPKGEREKFLKDEEKWIEERYGNKNER